MGLNGVGVGRVESFILRAREIMEVGKSKRNLLNSNSICSKYSEIVVKMDGLWDSVKGFCDLFFSVRPSLTL